MAAQTVTLWCSLRPATGRESELRQVLLDLAAKVHAIEQTCVRYEVFEMTGSPAGPRSTVFHLLEQWPSQGDLDRHTQREWLVDIRKKFDAGLLAEAELIENTSKIGGFSGRS